MPQTDDRQDDGRSAPPSTRGGARLFPERCILFVAMGFGIGRLPVASKAFGALLGLPMALGIMALHGHIRGQIALVAVLSLLAVPICDGALRILGEKEAGRIVADGYLLLPICFVGSNSFLGGGPVWEALCRGGPDSGAAVTFILFVFMISRFCTILKPSPIRQVRKAKGGWGIVLDDFFAALYTWVLAWGLKDLLASGLVAWL